MQISKIVNISIVGAAFVAVCPCIFGLGPDGKEALEQKLKEQYTVTKLTADGTDVVTPGAVLTLKKDNLILAPSTGTDISGNSYKDGKIVQGTVGKVNEKTRKLTGIMHKIPGIPGVPSTPDAPTNPTRTFVAGEKLNVTKIEAKDGAVVFELYSTKAYSDVYYRGTLTFPIKGTVPAPDDMLATVGQVFSVDPPEKSENSKSAPAASQGTAGPQPTTEQTAAQPMQSSNATATQSNQPATHFEEIAPPPPPPPPPPKLDKGVTIDQVTAQLGQPISTAKDGDKQICLYKDWKITFVKGKIVDVDAR